MERIKGERVAEQLGRWTQRRTRTAMPPVVLVLLCAGIARKLHTLLVSSPPQTFQFNWNKCCLREGDSGRENLLVVPKFRESLGTTNGRAVCKTRELRAVDGERDG